MKENPEKTNVWVLLSGGIDSSACVVFYLEKGFVVHSAIIDYGQVSAKREIQAAKTIAKYYHIPVEILKWEGIVKKNAGLILGRNAFLLTAALMELPESTEILAIGIHSGTDYLDCSPLFIKKMQAIFDTYTHGTVQIGTPFLMWTKRQVWDYCKARGVPLELTYSCELGADQPCGECLSCRDLEDLYACAENNITAPG